MFIFKFLQDNRLKQLFTSIPTLEDLHALGDEGLKADVILVDFQKDKKLFRQKQLITKLVSGLNTKPATIIKKIAGLVRIFEILGINGQSISATHIL